MPFLSRGTFTPAGGERGSLCLLLSYCDVEAGLLGFVFDEDLSCALMIEQHLAQHEFQIILMHLIARLRHLVVSHVRQVERRAVAMAGLRDGIDVSAALQVFDIFLRAQHRRHVETIMRQVVTL